MSIIILPDESGIFTPPNILPDALGRIYKLALSDISLSFDLSATVIISPLPDKSMSLSSVTLDVLYIPSLTDDAVPLKSPMNVSVAVIVEPYTIFLEFSFPTSPDKLPTTLPDTLPIKLPINLIFAFITVPVIGC